MSFLSEDHILAMIHSHFPATGTSLLMGRGDDCAVLKSEGALCISTDLFMENVHFRRSYFSAKEVGHKALAVNLSDIAAMGVRPLAFTLALGLPPYIDAPWLNDLFAGMSALAAEHNVVLAGGDISRAQSLCLSITVWGEGFGGVFAQGTGNYLSRGGAMPGDTLFIIGNLGLARVGLEELEKHGLSAKKTWPEACNAHLHPSPQVNAGLILSRSALHSRPPVLMDISDGLARDLPRLLGTKAHSISSEGQLTAHTTSSLGAQIILPKAFLHAEVIKHAQEHKRNPVHEAWIGGEDYGLLGACTPNLLPILHSVLPTLKSIGTITEDSGIYMNGENVDAIQGFDHFAQRQLEPA